MRRDAVLPAVILLALPLFAAEAPAPHRLAAPPPGMFVPPGRAITHVTGDVWRASNGGWYVGILDTPDGLLLVDTLNVPFATWLKAELARQFPGKPVKYVILSHSHWDHTEGGKVFADTATFIAQEGFLRNMDGRYPSLPGDIVDRNNDGWLDAAEFDDPGLARPWYCGGVGTIGQKDNDGDGRMTPAEFFKDTPRPDIAYADRMTLRFGGKTIDLVFPGKNHANDGTAVLFRDESVLFTVAVCAAVSARHGFGFADAGLAHDRPGWGVSAGGRRSTPISAGACANRSRVASTGERLAGDAG
jgi:glyoxylase-like metal-dependent hydrolase (beta-lactamase superfamily II)